MEKLLKTIFESLPEDRTYKVKIFDEKTVLIEVCPIQGCLPDGNP